MPCIETYAFVQHRERESDLRAAIGLAREFDLGNVPKKLQKATMASFDRAERTFTLVETVREVAAAVDTATPDYRLLHVKVRAIQRDVRRLEAEIKARRQRTSACGAADRMSSRP